MTMKQFSKPALGVVAGLLMIAPLSGCGQSAPTTTAPDFTKAVTHHLSSVESRDFETFKATLTQTNDLYVIFPGGSALETTEEVLDFHKNWFKDEAWIFKTNIVKVIEGTTQSTALVDYTFQDNAQDTPRRAWLVLTFQLEDGQWRLIHDQNTRINE